MSEKEQSEHELRVLYQKQLIAAAHAHHTWVNAMLAAIGEAGRTLARIKGMNGDPISKDYACMSAAAMVAVLITSNAEDAEALLTSTEGIKMVAARPEAKQVYQALGLIFGAKVDAEGRTQEGVRRPSLKN